MKNSLFRFVLLAMSAFQVACGFLAYDTGFSVNETSGEMGPLTKEVRTYRGEQNASRYKLGNLSVLLYANSYNSSLISLGVCAFPIIPTFGVFDTAAKENLEIVMQFWKPSSAPPDQVHILKAEITNQESHYSPEKIKITKTFVGEKINDPVIEVTKLPTALPQFAPFEVEFQYPINPQLIDDFFLDIEVSHSHEATLKDKIHFKYSDYFLSGCIP